MSPQPPESRRDEIRYDTQDGALRSRSVELVRRGRGSDIQWSLSLDLAGDRREFIMAGGTSRPSNLPAGLRRHLTPLTGGEPLLRQSEADGAGDEDGGVGAAVVDPPDAASALTAILVELSEQLLVRDLAVRLALPGAVHQMRVTCRFLRAVLEAASPFLDGDPSSALAARLRDLARVLGRARDAEVIAELLPARVEALADPIQPEAVELLQHRAAEGAATFAADARRHLERKEHLQLLADVQVFALRPPLTDKAEARSARGLANRLVRRSLREVQRVAAQPLNHPQSESAGEGPLRHVHEIRKAVKQVRYVLSVLQTIGTRPKKKIRRAGTDAKSYQRELGEVMDSAVLREWLALTGGELKGSELSYSVGLLLGAETLRVDEGIQRCEQSFAGLLKQGRDLGL